MGVTFCEVLSSAAPVGSETHSAKLTNEIKQVSKWQVTEERSCGMISHRMFA